MRYPIDPFMPAVQLAAAIRRMAGSGFVTWTARATSLPIPWEEALRRMENPDTVHGRQ
jgi:hypothetical protein